jgi:hypothetical protein
LQALHFHKLVIHKHLMARNSATKWFCKIFIYLWKLTEIKTNNIFTNKGHKISLFSVLISAWVLISTFSSWYYNKTCQLWKILLHLLLNTLYSQYYTWSDLQEATDFKIWFPYKNAILSLSQWIRITDCHFLFHLLCMSGEYLPSPIWVYSQHENMMTILCRPLTS